MWVVDDAYRFIGMWGACVSGLYEVPYLSLRAFIWYKNAKTVIWKIPASGRSTSI